MTKDDYDRACAAAYAEYMREFTAIEDAADVVRHPAEVVYAREMREARKFLHPNPGADAAEWRRQRDAAAARFDATCGDAFAAFDRAWWEAYLRYANRLDGLLVEYKQG